MSVGMPQSDSTSPLFHLSSTSSYRDLAGKAEKSCHQGDLLISVEHSNVLKQQEKQLYVQMLHCVTDFGINNDMELFKAVGYGFDFSFGPKCTHNIATIAEYLLLMGEKVKSTLGENDSISAGIFAHERLGFFLLTPDKEVYFLKEGANENLVLYDPKKDDFVDCAFLPICGKEKLVIPNKSMQPSFDTYFAVPTPEASVDGKFYHEKQQAGKCGIHAVHAFLGLPVINETQASLMKLEKTTNDIFPGRIKEYLSRQGRADTDASLLPRGQIAHFQDITRFELAQSADCHVEHGNDTSELLIMLKQMADQGVIDKKYKDARVYGIYIGIPAINYAKSKQLFIDGEDWSEELLQKLQKEIDCNQASAREQIAELDKQLQKMEEVEKSLPHTDPTYQKYIQLLMVREPYTILENVKANLEKSIACLRQLPILFEKSDRLLIASATEDHCFTMRKCENRDWCVIDSLDSNQLRVKDPLKWFTARQMSFFHTLGHARYEFVSLVKSDN